VKTLSWVVFGFFALGVGLYPLLYLTVDMSQGFLGTKSASELNNPVWRYYFYQHIFLGGLALLTGWTQFSRKLRTRHIRFHRNLGRIYVTACLLSGIAGLYLALFATGGLVASLGFAGLALAWLFTTGKAFLAIRRKRISEHQRWMIRSYALTFAAVTLRLWLPLSGMLQIDFAVAYPVVSWLCWVPNLLVAEWIVRSMLRAAVSGQAPA
jgi:uncharacterized membrane protein